MSRFCRSLDRSCAFALALLACPCHNTLLAQYGGGLGAASASAAGEYGAAAGGSYATAADYSAHAASGQGGVPAGSGVGGGQGGQQAGGAAGTTAPSGQFVSGVY